MGNLVLSKVDNIEPFALDRHSKITVRGRNQAEFAINCKILPVDRTSDTTSADAIGPLSEVRGTKSAAASKPAQSRRSGARA